MTDVHIYFCFNYVHSSILDCLTFDMVVVLLHLGKWFALSHVFHFILDSAIFAEIKSDRS